MTYFSDYNIALLGILFIIATLILQSLIGATVKAKQPGAIPGKIDSNLSHSSFVFRAHRTFMNSLENVPAMLATSFLAIFSAVNPTWTMLLIWIFAIARIIHMILYYVIATEKNPSPRSYFYLIGLITNIALLTLTVLTLL